MNGYKIAKLGWKPETDFANGLQRSIDWYLDNLWWLQ